MQCVIASEDLGIVYSNPCILSKKEIIGSQLYGPIKEFTMATCGCIYHQKFLDGYLMDTAKRHVQIGTVKSEILKL